ncbi:MAG: hypothetical protein HC777_02515 [Hyphomonadaceae bacterium]|nr:hypothetical protein [Hyphomonadaceae bacterium]
MDPLDYTHFLLWTGDICFIAGLILMAIVSASAGQAMGSHKSLPMQFGLKGQPTWFVSRRFGLLFAPTLAAAFGLLLTAIAHSHQAGVLTQAALSIGIARVAMAFAFVVAHIIHLTIALAWLKRQNKEQSIWAWQNTVAYPLNTGVPNTQKLGKRKYDEIAALARN